MPSNLPVGRLEGVLTEVPTKRRLPRAQRRSLVLRAALKVFAADGYDRASMDDIAAGAGVSKPVLYDHWDSKRDLYIAVLDQQVSALARQVLPRADPTEGTLYERIGLSALAALSFARERPDAWRLLFQEPVGDRKIAQAFRQMRAVATNAVATAILENGFKPPKGVDAELAAHAVATMLMRAVESLGDLALEEPSVDLDALMSIYMNLVCVGIRQLIPRASSSS
jgi:AcrR family transcriptional regulator